MEHNDDFENSNGHDDSLDVVSLVGEDDGEEHRNLDEDDIEDRSEHEFSRRKSQDFEKRENEDDDDDEEEEEMRRKSPPRFATNGFPAQTAQPLFGHAFAAALAAGGKPSFDGLLPPPMPPSAITPQEYLARYYQIMQQQQSHNAAAALSAAVAASSASKIGSPVLHRSYDSSIEQHSN